MAHLAWSGTSALWGLVGFLFAYFTTTTLYSWYRLRKVPGPRLASFSYLWVLSATTSGRLAWIYEDLPAKYGHLVRVGPNLLLTDDLAQLRKMSAARSPYGKDGDYKATIRHPDHHNMLSTTDLGEHDDIKSRLAGPYGGRETLAMEPIVDEILQSLIRHIRVHASTADKTTDSVPIDFSTVVNYFTEDVITRIAFGREFGCLESNSDVHGLLAAMNAAMKAYTIPISIPWLRDLVSGDTFMKYFGPKMTDKSGVGTMMRIARDAVIERYQPGAPDEKDLLGAFIRSGLEPGPCMSEVMIAMIAGNDTTAAAIRMTMLCLMTNPRVYSKFKSVVQEAVQNGTASNPIRFEEAKKMPYVQAVIYEGLRMRPPGPVMFGKVVPPQGDIIDGKFIPGGTVIAGATAPMMRAHCYWGSDSDIFRPERFLEVDDQQRAALERIVEMSFGYGRLKCAGQSVAFMELNKVFFEVISPYTLLLSLLLKSGQLFRHFDFQVVNPVKPWVGDFYTTWRDRDFFVHVTE
ncbi:hypothetical protein N0V93_004474 [Gnomoniopsis smithogilvyi]|uniref:Cytochrome P450 n=1 Tax=Gnomoniopsis smithogilvyi TaxID=1191159 RepID=A0A9W9CX45_9PEZI|nr:hypothetical protein N0V93_004474 [Gnomoniopsis smithogilvyi]